MRTIRIGNLGAGVQSTCLYLMELEGLIDPTEAWIFADTGDEPQAVYDHLAWMESLSGPRIIRASKGGVRLGDQLANGLNATGQQFVSIPAYTAPTTDEQRAGKAANGCEVGITRRQCTKEYKIEVIERSIRREILGLKHRQRMPKDVSVTQIFGLSDDEAGRIKRVKKAYAVHPWATPSFPLAEMGWTRAKCHEFLRSRVPHPVQRSACVFCPYRSAAEWVSLKETDIAGWNRAVEIDRAMRVHGVVKQRKFDQSLYLHRSCLPLEVIDFAALAAKGAVNAKTPDMFALSEIVASCDECSAGVCGV